MGYLKNWLHQCRINFQEASRKSAGSQKACRLLKPEHDVHVLDGAACLSLHEVVCHAHDYKLACPFIHVYGEFAEVAPPYVRGALRLFRPEDPYESFIPVKCPVDIQGSIYILSLFQVAVECVKVLGTIL
jgi:hypothetical protein